MSIARKGLGALAAVILIMAAPTALAAPANDVVAGTGTIGQFGDPQVHVNATDTAKGWKGSFTIEYPDGTYATGKVACASVSGGTAYVIGRITESGGPRVSALNWGVGNYIVIGVQDNGEPGTGDVPDQLNFSPGFNAKPACAPNGAATPVIPIVEGNFQVFDV
jgi:hypothetical protein